MKTFNIICCYGLVGDQYRSDKEMRGLRLYFSIIHSVLKNKSYPISVFSGGFTNKAFPDKSEAETSIEFWNNFRREVGWGEDVSFQAIPELNAKTGEENIYYGIQKAIEAGFDPVKNKVTIFCDQPRQWKMQVICFFLLKQNGISYKINQCNRIDTNIKSNSFVQFFISIKMLSKARFWDMKYELKKLLARK